MHNTVERRSVFISVKSETDLGGGQDIQKMEYQGTRYENKGRTFLRYETEGVRTLVKITGTSAEIHTWRDGAEYTMPFESGIKTHCPYPTAHGVIPMEISETRVSVLEVDQELRIRLSYRLSTHGMDLGRHKVRMIVKTMG
ncbi:MAG: DUF1934 domain-containing protein [Lachnospiraceae bacterium]|nr:DUF1934 domain-containing protein [Lachnospiraceae bacterium]